MPSVPKHAALPGLARRAILRRRRGATLRETLEWLASYFGPAGMPIDFAGNIRAPWYDYPLYLVAAAVLVLAASAASSHSARVSARMAGPRPRVVYLFFGCCLLAAAAPYAIVGQRLPRTGWESDALGETLFVVAFLALVMLGRAAAWGRVRPYFWLHPPGGAAASGAGLSGGSPSPAG